MMSIPSRKRPRSVDQDLSFVCGIPAFYWLVICFIYYSFTYEFFHAEGFACLELMMPFKEQTRRYTLVTHPLPLYRIDLSRKVSFISETDSTFNQKPNVTNIDWETVNTELRHCQTYQDVNVCLAAIVESYSIPPIVAATALKRVTQISKQRYWHLPEQHNNCHISTEERVLCRDILSIVLPPIEEALFVDTRHPNSLNVSSTVNCFLCLHHFQRKRWDDTTQPQATNDSIRGNLLQWMLWDRLEQFERDEHSVTQSTSSKRLLYCFRVSTPLLQKQPKKRSEGSYLHSNICLRLCRSDALGRLSTNDYISILSTLASTPVSIGTVESLKLLQAVTRRLRKKSVLQSASRDNLLFACNATRRFFLSYPLLFQQQESILTEENSRRTDLQELRTEMQIMTYGLIRQILNETTTTSTKKMMLWSPMQIACVFRTMYVGLNVSKDDILVQRLCLISETVPWTGGMARISDVSTILGALSKWQIQSFPSLIHSLGMAFDVQVEKCLAANSEVSRPEPCHINTILRSVALLGCIPQPYLKAANHLFLDDIFLKRCNAVELSNFAWFVAFHADKYWYENHKVQEKLATRILDSDIVVSCTPQLACRILNAFSALFSLSTNDVQFEDTQENDNILVTLFQSLGEQLLSSQLTPLDISSAIYAYAKANYVFDMGIFDYLVEVMASRVNEYSVRQISQALWACGRMVIWESNDEVQEPPYLTNAFSLASYLAHHAGELTTKDVAQALWALARLKIQDNHLSEPMVYQAQAICGQMNTSEVANILWALSRLRSEHFKVVYVITRRFANPMDQCVIKPQEASTVLYALGKMNIRDDEVFRNLSLQMLEQVNATSAQAIANAFWAHRAVHIEPPQILIDTWAMQRLGLKTAFEGKPFHYTD